MHILKYVMMHAFGTYSYMKLGTPRAYKIIGKTPFKHGMLCSGDAHRTCFVSIFLIIGRGSNAVTDGPKRLPQLELPPHLIVSQKIY